VNLFAPSLATPPALLESLANARRAHSYCDRAFALELTGMDPDRHMTASRAHSFRRIEPLLPSSISKGYRHS